MVTMCNARFNTANSKFYQWCIYEFRIIVTTKVLIPLHKMNKAKQSKTIPYRPGQALRFSGG